LSPLAASKALYVGATRTVGAVFRVGTRGQRFSVSGKKSVPHKEHFGMEYLVFRPFQLIVELPLVAQNSRAMAARAILCESRDCDENLSLNEREIEK